VPYKGAYVSTNSILRSFERFTGVYQAAMLDDEEAPYPLKAMADKLDPLVMEEMVGENATCANYITKLLRDCKVGAELARKQARFLTTGFTSHGTVLHRDALLAEEFHVVLDTKYPAEWRIMRQWLKKHVGESGTIHRMMYCLPKTSSSRIAGRRTGTPRPQRSRPGVRKGK
jgi:hypothetical protein